MVKVYEMSSGKLWKLWHADADADTEPDKKGFGYTVYCDAPKTGTKNYLDMYMYHEILTCIAAQISLASESVSLLLRRPSYINRCV